MKFWNNNKFVNFTPVLTPFLLEGANISQLWRMWTEGTAEGQSIQGWILVNIALFLWLNFYRVCMPKSVGRTTAMISTAVGIVFNFAVILTVLYFRKG